MSVQTGVGQKHMFNCGILLCVILSAKQIVQVETKFINLVIVMVMATAIKHLIGVTDVVGDLIMVKNAKSGIVGMIIAVKIAVPGTIAPTTAQRGPNLSGTIQILNTNMN